jgi:hypothetical protein
MITIYFETECPQCEGSGYTESITNGNLDDYSAPNYETETCDRCEGHCTITLEFDECEIAEIITAIENKDYKEANRIVDLKKEI